MTPRWSHPAWLALTCLTVQSSMLSLVIHQATTLVASRRPSTLPPSSSSSSSSSLSSPLNIPLAVLCSETLKWIVSTGMYGWQTSSSSSSSSSFSFSWCSVRSFGSFLFHSLFHTPQWYSAGVPACLYTVQNGLQYVALTYMDAASYQVTYQWKVVTTAVWSVVLLNTSLHAHQWWALVGLMVGIGLVQWPTTTPTPTPTPTSWRSLPEETGSNAPFVKKEGTWVGLGAVGLACGLSGFSGVWVEKLIKAPSTHSVWLRNMQLSFFSMLFAGMMVGVLDPPRGGGDMSSSSSPLAWKTWGWIGLAIACQAGVGLTVSLVMKYADAILKGFASGLSILLSSWMSMYFFQVHWTCRCWVGAGLVIVATLLYTSSSSSSSSAPSSSSSSSSSSSWSTAHVSIPIESFKKDLPPHPLDTKRWESGVHLV
ncbi:hypothetical protein HMI55_003363 [Coelomomyces lativittatus]|nr:hypothetical protein HMI55_003363 [Coelomomyces lativittatus]KAJ1504440.1 hypothetical protein HMI56_001625 [Coelomomyces lativittatus]